MTRIVAWPCLVAATLWPAAALAQPQPDKSCQPEDLEQLSGWSGVWLAEGAESDINGREPSGSAPTFIAFKLIGVEAPWNNRGWELMERYGAPPDGTGPQSVFGFPMMMSAPSPFTIVVAPDQTVMISEYRDVRYIFTDGRGHIPEEERWGTIWGDSVGCWDGDTLTIETVSVRHSPEYTIASPPLSENARFEEKIRLTAPGRLESDIIVTDPETLVRPWVVHMVYRRAPNIDRIVHEGDISVGNRIVFDGTGATIAETQQGSSEREISRGVQLSTAELDKVAGRYAFDGMPLELTLERREDTMFFRVDPGQPFFLPLRANDPLHYFSNMPAGTFEFTVDAAGDVTGFTGTAPDGERVSGQRKP